MKNLITLAFALFVLIAYSIKYPIVWYGVALFVVFILGRHIYFQSRPSDEEIERRIKEERLNAAFDYNERKIKNLIDIKIQDFKDEELTPIKEQLKFIKDVMEEDEDTY